MLEDFGDQEGPSRPAPDVGRAAFEREGDVVVVDVLAAVGIHDREVVSQAGVEIEIVLRKNDIAGTAHPVLHVGVLEKRLGNDRGEPLPINVNRPEPPHVRIGHSGEESFERNRTDRVGRNRFRTLRELDAAAQVHREHLHGQRHPDSNSGMAAQLEVIAYPEHFQHRFLVGEADDVMKRTAALG